MICKICKQEECCLPYLCEVLDEMEKSAVWYNPHSFQLTPLSEEQKN